MAEPEKPPPINLLEQLQLGPIQTDQGKVQALNQLRLKLNEIIVALNTVIDRVNEL
jgi:hypothetical protein